MIVQNVNQIKLHKELSDAGIKCTLLAIENGVKIIFLEDVDMQLAQSIVDVHVPTPIAPQLSEIEKLRLEQAQANTEIIQLIMMMGGGIA